MAKLFTDCIFLSVSRVKCLRSKMEPIVWLWGRQSTLWIICLIPGLSKYGLWEDDIVDRYREKQLYGQQYGVLGFEYERIEYENKR